MAPAPTGRLKNEGAAPGCGEPLRKEEAGGVSSPEDAAAPQPDSLQWGEKEPACTGEPAGAAALARPAPAAKTAARCRAQAAAGGRDAENLARPAAADLFRVIAAGMVAWFHIWQQSWVGAGRVEHWPRTGAVWVDVLILLSAFCLFLPYANAAAQGLALPETTPARFYRKRVVRILPSYYLCLAASLAMVIRQKGWSKALAVDLLSHLTLTQMFFPEGYTWAQLNGVTWTLTIFALFYLVFPWLAPAAARRPVETATALLAVQLGYSLWVLPQYGTARYAFLFNQFPAFCGVFAVGFAGAAAFARLGRQPAARTRSARLCFTLLGLAALWCVDRLLRLQNAQDYQRVQLANRMPLTLAVCTAMVCLALGVAIPLRRVWRFLAGISFNLYLWHQMLAVWCKYYFRIPAWTGEIPPNQLNDTEWMIRYNLLCWALALGSALLFTYGVEKPAARFFARRAEQRAGRNV